MSESELTDFEELDLDPLVRLKLEAEAIEEPAYARGALYGSGFAQGILDGLRVGRAFDGLNRSSARVVGPRLALRVSPEPDPDGRIRGELPGSSEAHDHLARLGHAGEPVCHVAAGYASGWITALRREVWLAREVTCRATDAARCVLELEPLEECLASALEETRELLPFLELDAVCDQLESAACPSLEIGPECEAGEGLEAMSPAIHVWGPVLVLPYSGARDGASAFEAARRDGDGEEIQVVVVDVVGARLDGTEAVGLPSLVRVLHERGLDVIVAGGRPQARGGARHPGLETVDLPSAIALAFQLCAGPDA